MDISSKIYVAGHTGLLGSALMKQLKLKGYKNIIVRSHSELDLTNYSAVDNFIKKEKPEYIFLSAGKVGGIMGNKAFPADFLHINIAIQDNVFEASHKYNVKHLIFYGSSCTYPKQCRQPMKETDLLTGPIEETSEGYAAAKIAGIIACRSYNRQYNTDRYIALLPNSMYGPEDNFDLENSHVLSSLIRKFHEAKVTGNQKVVLWGTGKPRREFVFCEDIASASIFVMNNVQHMENRHYNIGTGIDYLIRELAEAVKKVVEYNGEIQWDTSKPDGALRKLLDSSDFLKLGWKPTVTLEEGLKITYEWYKANHEFEY
jgi:GDP-L-fucose synthase